MRTSLKDIDINLIKIQFIFAILQILEKKL